MNVFASRWWLALTAAAVLAAAPQCRARREPPVTVIAYGDTRFTDPSNTTATNPEARRVLVSRIADERPDAILISGDLPWHGGVAADYDVFLAETQVWRRKRLRILPALGNHEFAQGTPADCLEHWWTAFPELRGRRWYAADIGESVRSVALDTMSPLVPGSEQRLWLEHELTTLSERVQFVLIALHHPPVADIQTRLRVDHNPRPNEIALKAYLAETARVSRARFVVIAGHIHNYERFLDDDVVYVVSGGGGAVPYEVDRTQADLYQRNEFPNYHYVKLTIGSGVLNGEMCRLDEPSAPHPHFTVKDRFTCAAAR
jgi:acid phosphatase type 7